MSRRLTREVRKAQGGRGRKSSPAPRTRTPEQRLNRIFLIGGGGLALGAIVLALIAPHFDPVGLGINLGAILVGLMMGKVIGKLLFRRATPTTSK